MQTCLLRWQYVCLPSFLTYPKNVWVDISAGLELILQTPDVPTNKL
jgi:hypothetical protein